MSASLAIGAIGAIAFLLATWNRPQVALVIWLLSFAFVPTWIGLDAGTFIPLSSIVAAGTLAVTLGSKGWQPSRADLAILVMITAGFLAVYAYDSSQYTWASMITQWLVPYLAAKAVIARTGIAFASRALIVVMTAVAALAIIEFVFRWHPYVNVGSESVLHDIWGPIQERGGVDRSEWAFGHSIALAGALAITVPFVLGSPLRGRTKALVTLLLGAATATTFSRAGLLAFGLALVLSVLFQSDFTRRQKTALTSLLAVAAIGAVPLVGQVFDTAGSEATNSSSYRGSLLQLVPTINAVGRSSAAVIGGNGSVKFGTFGSIDNTFLQLGLGFGWIVGCAALVPFLIIVVRLLLRRATTVEIALVTALPVLVTVAMITQWQSIVWLLAGFAVVATQRHNLETKAVPIPSAERRKTPSSSRRNPRGSVVPRP